MEDKRITDEEIAQNPNMYRDEDGVYLKLENGRVLIESSDKWRMENNFEISLPEVSDTDILAETVSLVLENNDIIAKDVALNLDDSAVMAETLAMVLTELQTVKNELAVLKGGTV